MGFLESPVTSQLLFTPKMGANGLEALEIDRGHPHVVNSRANPEKPGYGLKPSGII